MPHQTRFTVKTVRPNFASSATDRSRLATPSLQETVLNVEIVERTSEDPKAYHSLSSEANDLDFFS